MAGSRCCGRVGTSMVAGVGFVADIILAIFFIIPYAVITNLYNLPGGIRFFLLLPFLFQLCFAISHLLVVCGLCSQNPSLILPYLGLKPLSLWFYVWLSLKMMVILISFESFLALLGPLPGLDERNGFFAMFKATFLIVLFCTVLHISFYNIIFPSYIDLKEKSASDNANSSDSVGAVDTCCYGPFRCRIETGVPVVVLVGTVFQLGDALACFFISTNSVNGHLVYTLLGLKSLICGIAYISVIFAQKARNPSLFLPFLYVVPFFLLLDMCAIGFGIIWLIYGSIWLADGLAYGRILLAYEAVNLLLFVFNVVLSCWFYSIVFRAYGEIKKKFVPAKAEEGFEGSGAR